MKLLLAECPDAERSRDVEGMRALDYARERGWRAAADALAGEAAARSKLLAQWRSRARPAAPTPGALCKPCRWEGLSPSPLSRFAPPGGWGDWGEGR